VDGKKSDYFFLGKAFQSNDKSENPHSIIFKHILHKQKERSGVKNKFPPDYFFGKSFNPMKYLKTRAQTFLKHILHKQRERSGLNKKIARTTSSFEKSFNPMKI